MDWSRLTLREKIFQTFLVTIREINKHGGPEAFFAEYPAGGLFFSLRNPQEDGLPETGTSLSPARLEECRKASRLPLLICADQYLLPGQKCSASTRSLGSSRDEQDAYDYGKIIGMQMNALGADWVLAPAIDMYFSRGMPFPAMSDDPVLTAKLYRLVVRGIQDQGVCATAKHFPGLGTDNVNPHFAPGKNVLPFDEWMRTYGYTYQEMIREGVCSVMTTHVALKSWDGEGQDGYAPVATYSGKLTAGLLKQKLGFEGAVVTDAVVMGGMVRGNPAEEAAEAFKCGADFLLWPPVEAADRIEAMIRSGEIPMSRLDDACARIERMRSFREETAAQHTPAAPDAAFAESASGRITADGICCLKNEIGLLPLDAAKCRRVLIVNASDNPADGAAQYLRDGLAQCGVGADIARDFCDAASNVYWQEDIDALQAPYDAVIFSLNAEYRKSWDTSYMLIWASHFFSRAKKIIVNYGSPFFADDYFPEDPTIVEVNAAPSRETVRLLLERLLGRQPFTGNRVAGKKP